jgi:hypothetical protein
VKKIKKANLEEESQIKGGVKSEPYYLQVKLRKEEFDFINFMLSDIQTSPLTKEGCGYRLMAYAVMRKINGFKVNEFVREEFEKKQKESIKKYIDSIINSKGEK